MFWIGAGGVSAALVVPDTLTGLVDTEQVKRHGDQRNASRVLPVTRDPAHRADSKQNQDLHSNSS